MPQIDPVILKLEADLADYKRGVTQAQRLTDQKLGDIQRSADRMGSGVSRAFSFAKASALAFVAANGIGAIKDLISRGLEYASSLQEQAAQLGVTSDALQEYYYLASQVGVTNEEMEQGLVMLNRRIGLAAAGNKEAANAFEQLGVEIKDATGHVRNAADLIPELAQGMSELGSDAERVAAATLLFGRSGAKLLPAL